MVQTRKEIYNYVMSDLSWKCDLPQFLNEAQICTKGNAYDVCWNLLRRILVILTKRAVELNDPVMNIIMLNLSLYDGSHSRDVGNIINHLRKEIECYEDHN